MTIKTSLDVLVGGINANIDLVAVHGLNPKGKDDHATMTWTAGDKLWLRDFLPRKLPNARVLLYSYNSSIGSRANLQDMVDHAKTLLDLLEMRRSDINDPARPIVFIAHSLGGLVVKQALVEAKDNDQYAPIRIATHGIAFFATPHRGGNHAALGDVISSIYRAVLRKPSNKLLKDLQQSSRALETLTDRFRHQCEAYYYVNFWEALPAKSIGGLDTIVDKHSAQLDNIPGTRQKVIGRDSDHSSICKFATDDNGYEQVEQAIVMLAQGALKRREQETTSALYNSSVSPHLIHQEFSGSSPSLSQWQSSHSSPHLLQLPFPVSSPNLHRVKSAEGLGLHNKAIFQVPYNRNHNFVGRKELMAKLLKRLASSGDEPHKVALYGLGGVGKTALAVRCAYEIHDLDPDVSVLWIQARNLEHSSRSITKIAKSLGVLKTEDANADVLDLLREHLRQSECGKWLIVIEADDFQSGTSTHNDKSAHQKLLGYIPDCPHGAVLLTTRDGKVAMRFAEYGVTEQVLPLSKTESEELVHRILLPAAYNYNDVFLYSPNEQILETLRKTVYDGVEELTEALHHFPLAIVQATSFLLGNDVTPREYLQHYRGSKNNALELFDRDDSYAAGDGDAGRAVTTTLMLSFEQLQEKNLHAAKLFSVMAFLDSNSIPESLLRGVDHDMTWPQFQDACGHLKAFSFISKSDSKPPSYNVQPLVQQVMRVWLQKNGQSQTWIEVALVALSTALPSPEISREEWKAYETYYPHVQVVLEHPNGPLIKQMQLHKAHLSHRQAWYFRIRGYHDTAEQLAREALETRRRELGNEDEATLASAYSLSRILFEQDKMQEAEVLQTSTLAISEQKFGAEHKDVLAARGLLATIHGVNGRYEDALKLQEEVLEISKRIMGQCPLTWLAMRDLAITYNYIGRKRNAYAMQLKVLAACKKHFGDDHPETLTIMRDLATTYIEQKRFEDAEDLLKNLLEQSERVLGERHPHTVATTEQWRYVSKELKRVLDVEKSESASTLHQQKRNEDATSGEARARPTIKRSMSDTIKTYAYRSPEADIEGPSIEEEDLQRSDSAPISSIEKPTYSNSWLIRSAQKKYERNVNKEAGAAVLKETKDFLETTKTRYIHKDGGTVLLKDSQNLVQSAKTKFPWGTGRRDSEITSTKETIDGNERERRDSNVDSVKEEDRNGIERNDSNVDSIKEDDVNGIERSDSNIDSVKEGEEAEDMP